MEVAEIAVCPEKGGRFSRAAAWDARWRWRESEMMLERRVRAMILGLLSAAHILCLVGSQGTQGSDKGCDEITCVVLWKMDWRKPDK